MNAQRLINNKIAISNVSPRKDAIQVIENLKVTDFYNLVKSARNWDKSLNDNRDIMFTTYENEQSKIYKEFEKIYKREIANKEYKENFDSLLKEKDIKDEDTPFKLVKFPKSKSIRLCKRGSTKKNYKNALLITEKEMKKFSHDAKRYNKEKYTEIHFDDNSQNYIKWEIFIDNKLKEILKLDENN